MGHRGGKAGALVDATRERPGTRQKGSARAADTPHRELQELYRELQNLRAEMVDEANAPKALLDSVHPRYRESVLNLMHYLVLRRHDLRPLQQRLAALGLSSLGRAESYVLATLDAVLSLLQRLTRSPGRMVEKAHILSFANGQKLLKEHTDTLLGPPPEGRTVRIMVTMPSEAASEYTLVHDLLEEGMDCMRINCAHDDAATWEGMIKNLQRAKSALHKPCQVVFDLGGPKLRTGPIEPGPAVLHVRPQRDVCGRVTAPARIWLTAESSPCPPPSTTDATLPVPAELVRLLRRGEVLSFSDAREAKRTLSIVDTTEAGCWAEAVKTCYFVSGTRLHRKGKSSSSPAQDVIVGSLPPLENALVLHQGDLLIVTRNLKSGRAATVDSQGRILTPARIGCTIPDVFEHVRAGESIWFDDGMIGGVVEKVEPEQVAVRITQTLLGSRRLRAGKGINLPDSALDLPAMTEKDEEDLAFVSQYADVVELSFANSARDVQSLQQHLRRGGDHVPGIVLKIETRHGFQNLPEMLLTAMQWPCCGVMIARGDLAVECGFERLAEVQEEILWICEAAHIPVIWATQVLENLAKVGMPSRAEITDAAMGHRAECVMLNKGPFVVSAVQALDDILRRMATHQTKKRSMLRQLHLADGLGSKIAHGLPMQV